MKRIVSAVVATIVLVACHHERPEIVQSDIDAWDGAPLVELETHPVISSQPREVRPVSDGSELWIYTNCVNWQDDAVCRSFPVYGGGAVTRCSGGGSGTNCCRRSFQVSTERKRVKWMTLAGMCHTTCADRPASRPCAPGE